MWNFIKKYKSKIIQDAMENLDMDNPLDSQLDPEWKPLLQKIHNRNLVKSELESMRREFSANVSHELKTPLTSISGYAELLAAGMVKEEHVEEFAEKIHTESQRLLCLIEDVIQISRLDERGVEVEREEVDLFALTRDICSRLSYFIEQKNISLQLTGKSVSFFGVKSVLDEILYNVCENAVKYNNYGGTLEIWVGTTLQGPRVMVTDTGIGIPIDEHVRVFERFYRVDKSHSKNGAKLPSHDESYVEDNGNAQEESEIGGTGLGLSIVKNGAKSHNIDVDLHSTLGVGTKVILTFPK